MAAKTTVALVTGGNNGIGFETCMLLASQPQYHVIMGSRSLEKGQAALAHIQSRNLAGSISLVQLDVTSDASIDAARKEVASQWGHLDILINNAGICPLTFDREVLREVLETNTISPGLVTQAFAPLLKKANQARVVYVSSALGSIGMRSDLSSAMSKQDYKSYRISKAALNMLVTCDAWQYEKDGIKVFAFCPGYVVTDLAGMRQAKIDQGAPTAEGSARGLLDIAEGKRDADAGKFLHIRGGDGVHPW
ncbi:hypothetical protein MMC28_008357 [Mycoblastus sanguinarius]|nr:hypothetical protein [Mycoblastus sanguinarius]